MGPSGSDPALTPVLILAGGRGERLAGVGDRPKPLIEIAGRPFIGYLLEALGELGFRRVVLLTGDRAEQFPELLATPAARQRMPFLNELDLRFLPEEQPLGTAGALRPALPLVADAALVLNGDSFCEVDYAEFMRAHLAQGAAASLVATWIEDAGDYGALDLDADSRVRAFREKGVAEAGWINAGVYAIGRSFLERIPVGPASLEREILPDWSRRAEVWAYRTRAYFRDIGTPERLALAQSEFPRAPAGP